MDERLGLSLTQRQQTTLAPMQLQFVKMLEMTGAEAEEEVARMLDDNPALEVADDQGEELSQNDFSETAEELQRADYSSDEEVPSYRLGVNNRSRDDTGYEPTATTGGESLYEYLMTQLAEDPEMTERDMMIASHVVGNIDANGYMERSVGAIADDLAIQEGVDVADDEVKRVWHKVRDLEPAGVGAVDLRDSLLLQLHRREPTDAVRLATEIVDHYFDLFSLMHFDRLASQTGATREQLQQAMEAIRMLNPKPGSLISGDDDDRTRHITPDFYVEPDGDRLTLQMLNHLPQLRVEQSFAADTKVERRPSAAIEAANAFIRQKRDEAQTFIRVLEMRNRTLFRVVSAIVQWQREFFLTGDRLKLRPMVLKDISAVTGDDLSVISRATTGKYIASPYGVYSLKSLFNEARSDGGDASASSAVVMDRLRQIISDEDKSKPLSDAEITSRLNDEGFDIARRTVAKYRERLGLPVGRLRKKI